MHFYEVAPADRNYHGQEFLTYSHDKVLNKGQLVVVKLRTKSCVGFVIKSSKKPSFSTKPILRVIDDIVLTGEQLMMFDWIREYYPSPLGTAASLFVPPALETQRLPSIAETPHESIQTKLPKLTGDQTKAIKLIYSRASGTTILHGDTGSGKTRVYLELTQEALASGKSVLILTPEISLTPQLVATFRESVPGVSVTHSQQTSVTRRNLWLSLSKSCHPQVVIGPRSALFMPVKNLGLIVVDEFHDGAYKNEQTPNYHAVRVASKLARSFDARLVLGSATPSVNEYYYASLKNVPVARMADKAISSSYAPTKNIIVDLANQNERSTYPLLSVTLLNQIEQSLKNKEQILLFINKRGSARLLVCQKCGWKGVCEKCDLPMVYHQDHHRLQCHTCGNTKPAPNTCPECGSSEIQFKSPGTKAVVASLEKRFPDAHIARFDKDNTASERLDRRHNEIVDGSIDILVGTQLLAKGHDLPRLSLVGILLADSELSFPDYSSEERSYQLIHQLAGRVGRGHRAGTVVIQTYSPDSMSVKTIGNDGSWLDFYQSQLKERKQFGFPPFYHTLKIEVARAKSTTAETAINSIREFITQHFSRVEIVGPSPSFIAKRNNVYNWQMIIKAKERSELVSIARSIPIKSTFDIDPLHLL